MEQVDVNDAKSWDLVLFLPREEWDGTHTATFVRMEWKNNIVILDAFTEKTKAKERVIPIYWNIHKIVLVSNKYFEWY